MTANNSVTQLFSSNKFFPTKSLWRPLEFFLTGTSLGAQSNVCSQALHGPHPVVSQWLPALDPSIAGPLRFVTLTNVPLQAPGLVTHEKLASTQPE